MTVINTNVKSLVAMNAIEGNNNSLSKSMQRLSTGYRVNSAADDAAGLAIGSRMTAQIRGLGMAIKNANDGISLLQTADGAMDEITSMIQRMRELSVQAATDTVAAADRANLNKEVVALQTEINRIAKTTKFNGFNILDGSFQKKFLQIGDRAGALMQINIKNVESASLGSEALAKGTLVSGRTNISALAGSMIINNSSVQLIDAKTSSPVGGGDVDLNDVIASVNASKLGVTASAYNEVVARYRGSGVYATGKLAVSSTALDTGKTTTFTLGATNSLQDVVDQINAQGSASTVLARLNEDGKLVLYNNSGATIGLADTTGGAAPTTTTINNVAVTGAGFSATDGTVAAGSQTLAWKGFLKLSSDTNDTVSVEFTAAADIAKLGLNKVTPEGMVVGSGALAITSANFGKDKWLSGSMTINGVDIWNKDLNMASNDDFVKAINLFSNQTGVTAGLNDSKYLTLKSGDNSPIQIKFNETFAGSANINLLNQNVGAADYSQNGASLGYFAGGASVGMANVLTQDTASAAIKVMDGALDQVNSYRANLGAFINRLNSTVSNLSSVATNAQASRSRILDTDYATETTNLARAQIIQQAATAMLAQANQSAQTVLTLLK